MTSEPLSPSTAVFLLVDQDRRLRARCQGPPREQVEANVLRLARAAAILEVPAIFTTSEEQGENGTLLAPLEQILPDAYASRIDRHGIIDSIADPAVVQALAATGRRQLVTAGIGTEVAAWLPRCTPTATATGWPSSPTPAARRPHSGTTSACGGSNR
jgi:nicotinamidase-related amidase